MCAETLAGEDDDFQAHEVTMEVTLYLDLAKVPCSLVWLDLVVAFVIKQPVQLVILFTYHKKCTSMQNLVSNKS